MTPDQLTAENERLKKTVYAAQELETYLIDCRWFDETGEPGLTGFPTAELAMLTDALDGLNLRSAATTAAAMSYGGPEDPAIKPEADDGR